MIVDRYYWLTWLVTLTCCCCCSVVDAIIVVVTDVGVVVDVDDDGCGVLLFVGLVLLMLFVDGVMTLFVDVLLVWCCPGDCGCWATVVIVGDDIVPTFVVVGIVGVLYCYHLTLR